MNVSKILQKRVKNFSVGRGEQKPIGICLHIMEGTMAGSRSWFNNPQSRASYHYGVSRTGEIWQFVKEENVAWSQGRVNKPTARIVLDRPGVNPNRYLISIGHEGFSTDTWTEAMKQASAWLIQDICLRHNIPINRTNIIGHYEITIGRPNCPAVNKAILDRVVNKAKIKNLRWQLEVLKQKLLELLEKLKGRK